MGIKSLIWNSLILRSEGVRIPVIDSPRAHLQRRKNLFLLNAEDGKGRVTNRVRVSIALGLLISTSAFSRSMDSSVSYACLNADGVPIPNGSDLAQKCCGSGATTDSQCRLGFGSIASGSGSDAAAQLSIARQELQSAASLLGDEFGSKDSKGASVQGGSQTSAMTAGGSTGSSGNGAGSNSGLASGGSNGGGGGGSGGSGSGGGASGFGSSGDLAGGGTKGLNSQVGDGGPGQGGKYASGNAATAGGGDDSKGVAVASLGDKQIKYGEGALGEGGNGMGSSSGADGSGLTGSKEDAPDYLKRIDVTASLFKVVSTRYQREISRNRVQ